MKINKMNLDFLLGEIKIALSNGQRYSKRFNHLISQAKNFTGGKKEIEKILFEFEPKIKRIIKRKSGVLV